MTASSGETPQGITFQPDIYPKVLSLLPEERATRILDAGAGEGYFSRLLAERGYAVEACDYRADPFKVPEVPFHQAELSQSIPLPDNAFDCVVSIEVIEHIENHFRFIAELLRITRPGGQVILTTPNILSIPSRRHFFLYGYTDCAPRPLDPTQEAYYLQHINPISLPQIMFIAERFGGRISALTTNRMRRSAWVPMILLYPLLAFALHAKLLRKKYHALHPLYRRHIHWMLKPANLMGRITIVCIRKEEKPC